MTVPHPGFSDAYQIAYVTGDLARGTEMLQTRFGVPPFSCVSLDLNLSTPAAAATIKVGIAWVGDLQIELIEPVSGAVEVYLAALPHDPSALAFHHLAMRVSGDIQSWHRVRGQLAEERIAIEGGRDDMRFAYLDERATLGHYLEYVWMSESFLERYPLWIPPSRRRAASQGHDPHPTLTG
jgi:hypothetical protein